MMDKVFFQEDQAHILLVEDDSVWASLVKRYLKKTLYTLYHVVTLEEAQKMLESSDFIDAILLDLNLPDAKGGIKTFTTVAEYSGNIPVIILTGESEGSLWLEVMKAGASGWLQKEKIDKKGYAIEVIVRYARIYKLLEQELIRERNQAKAERDRWGTMIDEIQLLNSMLLGGVRNTSGNQEAYEKTMAMINAAKNAGDSMSRI